MNLHEIYVPDFIVPAIVNDDITGLSDEERREYYSWLENEKINTSDIYLSEDTESHVIKYHELSGYFLTCNCIKMLIDIKEQ